MASVSGGGMTKQAPGKVLVTPSLDTTSQFTSSELDFRVKTSPRFRVAWKKKCKKCWYTVVVSISVMTMDTWKQSVLVISSETLRWPDQGQQIPWACSSHKVPLWPWIGWAWSGEVWVERCLCSASEDQPASARCAALPSHQPEEDKGR